jgi:cell wall assembly regulator SMI1
MIFVSRGRSTTVRRRGEGILRGVIYGKSLLALFSRDTMAGRSALEEWQNLARRADLGASAEDPGETSFPPGAIRRCFGCRGWVPLHWDGNRNYLGIDIDPGPNGVVGQVINFGGDEHRKFVLATSWGRFLEDFADELEAGNFVIDKKHRYVSLLLKKPKKQPLYTQYEAWSRAKLDPAFRDRS